MPLKCPLNHLYYYMADVFARHDFPEFHNPLEELPFQTVAIPDEKMPVDICYLEDVKEEVRWEVIAAIACNAPHCSARMQGNINDTFRGEQKRRVYFLRMHKGDAYSVHTHSESESEGCFMPLKGSGIFVRGQERIQYESGNLIEIPRLCKHGFVETHDEVIVIAQQSKTIFDPDTGRWDYQVT